jgi:hypothetical protein
MDTDLLREQLTKLHQELGLARRVDPRSAELLEEIESDIKRLLANEQLPTPPATLPDRLERMAVDFEVQHPTLALSSRRLVDILGKIGV